MSDSKPSAEPLERAFKRLTEAHERYQADTSDDIVRDGLVQRFEFTYELGHKTLKRHLDYVSPTPGDLDNMSYKDVIRTGNEHGLLLGEAKEWDYYRTIRGKTSHTYDEEVALEVVEAIPEFIEEISYLLDKLKDFIDD